MLYSKVIFKYLTGPDDKGQGQVNLKAWKEIFVGKISKTTEYL